MRLRVATWRRSAGKACVRGAGRGRRRVSMDTRTGHLEADVGPGSGRVPEAVPGGDGPWVGPRLRSEQVWHAISKASFAVLGYVTPTGEPRSSGVVYKTLDRRLYVAVAPESWKAK